MGLIKIANIHSHSHTANVDLEEMFLASLIDLSFAKRFNDIVRKVLAVNNQPIHGIRFPDKFGNLIPILVEEMRR